MRNGIHGGPLDPALPFAQAITMACGGPGGFSPLLAYAIKWNETANLPNAATVVSDDGGHGLFQLTSSYPDQWADPYVNAVYAVERFLLPAETYWAPELQGDDLVRAIAAEFNCGRGNAIRGHEEGDLDTYTTDHYAARCLEHYLKLVAGEHP